MDQKLKKTVDILFVSAFLGALTVCAFLNAGTLKSLLESADKSLDGWQESAASVELSLKEKVKGKTKFMDLCGLSLMALRRNLVGNFEFVKDDAGIIQCFEDSFDEETYIESIKQLKTVVEGKGKALVHAVLPNKAATIPEFTEDFLLSGTQSYILKERLKAEKIDCLNYDELISIEEDAPSFKEFYFKTDIHDTTYAEFWMARELVHYLSQKYQLEFPKANEVFDLKNYTVKTYDFIGNEVRSSGRYFAGIDKFEIYKPTFETNLTVNVPTSGESMSGSFEEVMQNGYENGSDVTMYTYWITDFGRYPSPYYQYINLNASENGPKILLVTDSGFMRGLSYLALACRKVTVLDPRNFSDVNFLATELQNDDYDVVVVVGTGSSFFNSAIIPDISLPPLPQKDMITSEEYGEWIDDGGIHLDTYNGDRVEDDSVIAVKSDTFYVKLDGWAADFSSSAPLRELYLLVGDVLMRCDYAIECTDVADRFHKDSLLKTGFQVTFPASYLKSGEVTEISFIGVSADGQYLYSPVAYQLAYS